LSGVFNLTNNLPLIIGKQVDEVHFTPITAKYWTHKPYLKLMHAIQN
jgi:hypothetical protein